MLKLYDVLSRQSREALTTVLNNDNHCHIVWVSETSASSALAAALSEQVRNKEFNLIELIPESESESIGIKSVRQLTTIAASSANVTTVVLINPAIALTIEAQNSLLKSLEEPSSSLRFILLANPKELLPTITSRGRAVPLHIDESAPVGDQTQRLFQAYRHDLDAVLAAQTDDELRATLTKHIDLAKQLVSGSDAQSSLTQLWSLDSAGIKNIIAVAQTILAKLIEQNPQPVTRYQALNDTFEQCLHLLTANGSTKLVTAKLVLYN